MNAADVTEDVLLERAALFVQKHGRFHREGVYSVRFPLHAASGLILRADTHELTEEVFRRMSTQHAN